jgi:hypothetical protein
LEKYMNIIKPSKNGSPKPNDKRRYAASVITATASSFVIGSLAIAVNPAKEFDKTNMQHIFSFSAGVCIGVSVGIAIAAWWKDWRKSRS